DAGGRWPSAPDLPAESRRRALKRAISICGDDDCEGALEIVRSDTERFFDVGEREAVRDVSVQAEAPPCDRIDHLAPQPLVAAPTSAHPFGDFTSCGRKAGDCDHPAVVPQDIERLADGAVDAHRAEHHLRSAPAGLLSYQVRDSRIRCIHSDNAEALCAPA